MSYFSSAKSFFPEGGMIERENKECKLGKKVKRIITVSTRIKDRFSEVFIEDIACHGVFIYFIKESQYAVSNHSELFSQT